MNKPIDRWCTRVCRAAEYLSALSLAAMTLLTVADVFLRYGFNKPIYGSGEFTGFLLGLTSFCGLIVLTRARSHIVISLLNEFLPPAFTTFSTALNRIFNAAGAIGFCIVLTALAYRQIHEGELTMVLEWEEGYYVAILAALAGVASLVGLYVLYRRQ